MKKRYVIGIFILVVAAISAIIIFSLPKPKEAKTVYMIGGESTFTNKRVMAFNEANGWNVVVLTNSNLDKYPQENQEDYSKVDIIQAGSVTFRDELNAKFGSGTKYNLKIGELPGKNGPIKVKGEAIMARTPAMFWVKDSDTSPFVREFVKAGFFIKDGNSFSIEPDKLHELFLADTENKTFKELGINIPGKVIIGFSNPADSSGGRGSAALGLSCLEKDNNDAFCETTVSLDKVKTDQYKIWLTSMFQNSGKMDGDNDSLLFCQNWYASDPNPTPIMMAGESCYASWYRNLSDTQKKIADSKAKNIGVYLKNTIFTSFTLIYTSDQGKEYTDFITKSPEFQQILSEEVGMQAGLFNNPPTYAGSFIDETPNYNAISFPLPAVMNEIKNIVKNYGK